MHLRYKDQGGLFVLSITLWIKLVAGSLHIVPSCWASCAFLRKRVVDFRRSVARCKTRKLSLFENDIMDLKSSLQFMVGGPERVVIDVPAVLSQSVLDCEVRPWVFLYILNSKLGVWFLCEPPRRGSFHHRKFGFEGRASVVMEAGLKEGYLCVRQ